MNNETFPITPPPEVLYELFMLDASEEGRIVAAYRAGADQELEACCHLLCLQGFDVVDDLRTARRPKPPSLKEEALKMLDNLERCTDGDYYTIRLALEQLDD